jgi:CDP-glycerol glycerophosphotransferase (TagB/SpsB family)
MKNKVLKIFSKFTLDHKLKDVRIEQNSLFLQFEEFPRSLVKRYVMIKDRTSGRRIQKPLEGKEISFDIDELAELAEDGNFDFYLATYVGSKKLLKRTPFTNTIKLIHYFDKENNRRIRFTKTKKNNFTIVTQKVNINPDINALRSEGNNVLIGGTLEIFNKDKKPVTAEIMIQRRDVFRQYRFNLNLTPTSEGLLRFEGLIYPEKLKFDLVKNSRWDLFLQLRDGRNKVVYKELVNLQSFKEFEKEEDRYLLNIEQDEEQVLAFYATEGSNSLALWYTDLSQFQRTYNIAKGKTVYNETCVKEKLDLKMVFFESFLGKNYSGNPKYIYEQMLKEEKFKDFTFVWSYTGDYPEDIPGDPILVQRETTEFFRYLAKSKYWVSNIILPVHKKREGVVYLQTWHGTPLKKLGFDIDIEGPETLARENFYIESRNWDYLISANRYSSEIFQRAFKYEKEMLEVGYPLNDIFYDDQLENKVRELKTKLNIPLNKKVILYAPTWRDNEMGNSWEHLFELKFDLDNYYEQLKDDYVLVLRMHHLISDALEISPKYKEFVYDFSRYNDIQELYVISDLLITDYSSVFFDYANSKRPILFYAYDFEEYKENIRGFYLDMEKDLPGPVLQDENELLHAIETIDEVSNSYKEKYEAFYKRFCSLEDGKSAKRVVDRVFK